MTPDWTSLLPSLVAISLALLTRQVFVALFCGVWVGAWLIAGAGTGDLLPAFLSVMDTHLPRALAPEDGSMDHISIALFTISMGGMIGIISKNGGMRGIVTWLTGHADNRKKGQAATMGMGFLVFFDDYANTLVVGNTMRPLMDRLKISREKLAFIVDSTAAPLAIVAVVTTWIGFQLSLMVAPLAALEGFNESAYEVMLSSLLYSFYPWLMFVFIFLIIYTGRDFGPMLKAERNGDKYCTDVQQENIDGGFKNPRAINMLFPVSILIVSLIGSLLYLGEGDSLRDILGSADPFKAMLWASLFSFTTAAIMSLLTKTLNAEEVMDAAYEGFSPMLLAVAILTFAWAIAGVNNGLHTADYVVSLLGENLDPWMLSALIFIVAAATSFATGTSWSTMAILIPLVIPLSWTVMGAHGIQDYEHFYLLYSAVAATMAGSVWGDHCSPISDTTILSSIASSCDHIEHVRTQLPYAMTVAFASLLFAILPTSFGAPWWLGMLLGSGILYIIIRFYGEEEA